MKRTIVARNLSTFAIAQLLQVDPGSVANWIDQKRLKAFRTPGGHRRVTEEDLVDFLRAHNMPIPPELQKHPRRALVVDDEKPVAQMVARALRTAHGDWEIFEAYDGFEAGTIVATCKPEVVILDIRMPGMDGFEVCRRIKSQEDTRSTEVIAITAYPSQENTDRILACGARACFNKPLDIEALIRLVETCMA